MSLIKVFAERVSLTSRPLILFFADDVLIGESMEALVMVQEVVLEEAKPPGLRSPGPQPTPLI